jgi:hypothetical protein
MLLFTVLCTGPVTIHYPVHQPTKHHMLFPPFFVHLTSTIGRIFLKLKQTHLEYNPIDLVIETHLFLILLLAFLFLLKESSEWHILRFGLFEVDVGL